MRGFVCYALASLPPLGPYFITHCGGNSISAAPPFSTSLLNHIDVASDIRPSARLFSQRYFWANVNRYIHATMDPHDDEMRYWRNLAMWRGHERLNPDYINNAIRDIYENDLRHNDRGIHQTRRSRTLHPLQTYTLHIPRARTSHVPRGNEAHPHAQTETRSPFLRPVEIPEEGVPPIIPSNTTHDQLPHLSSPTSFPSSGIQFHPLLQPLYHHPQPHYQQQPHSSHTLAYHRATEFDPPHPSNNLHHLSHPPLGEGTRINPEQMASVDRPQWRPPFAHSTPETWRAPRPSPAPTPELYAFRFPTRPLPRTPDPYPHPYVAAGWDGNTVFGQDPRSAQRRPPPLGTPAVASSVPQWSPGTWPPVPWPTDVPVRLAPWLIPNPINPDVPQIVWDVSTHPTAARRVTGAHVTLPLNLGGGSSTGAGIDHEQVTSPASDRILVRCDVGSICQLWGPIIVERPGGRVTIRDLFEGIYAFFQAPLTHTEMEHISSLGQDNYRLLVDAYRRRTTQRQLGVLRDREWRQGMRRVDCLGDVRWWWGAWVTYDSDGTWQLNLGLMNSAHRNT
ncbi:hypothetical protein EDC04DRAFT_460536 [Pisolithus marmoratus]|nr:hypothetical protein EDC04DRAFT_460536 [Pisolithus marmoratus]